ncbi:MAG: DUF4321 domain-containing protein [Firmicutes bacterium]|nr:DUF4321 domain-containing protein [Bacillota bacterium]
MSFKGKSAWTYILFVLIGYVLGAFIGEALGGISWLSWLNYGYTFGFPATSLELGFLALTFGFEFRITIASIIGLIISMVIHRYL